MKSGILPACFWNFEDQRLSRLAASPPGWAAAAGRQGWQGWPTWRGTWLAISPPPPPCPPPAPPSLAPLAPLPPRTRRRSTAPAWALPTGACPTGSSLSWMPSVSSRSIAPSQGEPPRLNVQELQGGRLWDPSHQLWTLFLVLRQRQTLQERRHQLLIQHLKDIYWTDCIEKKQIVLLSFLREGVAI